MKLTEITAQTRVPNGLQTLSDLYDGPRDWTLAESFADLKSRKITHLYDRRLTPLDFDAQINEQAAAGLRRAEAGETPSIGQTLALWYVARCNEHNRAYWADPDCEITLQKLASQISGARRQITSKR